jgi:adenylate cyclase
MGDPVAMSLREDLPSRSATSHDHSGAEAELWDMIAERGRPGADVAVVDRKIWDRFGCRRAVLFTDLSGFSRQTETFGILHFLHVIYQQRRLFFPIFAQYGGQLLKEEGDSFMVVFNDVAQAFDCAVAMQRATFEHNKALAVDEHVLLCLGLGFGDVLLIGDEDVWGREVNVASKLGEDTAKAGQILLSGAARTALGNPPGVTFRPVDERFSAKDQNFEAIYPRS